MGKLYGCGTKQKSVLAIEKAICEQSSVAWFLSSEALPDMSLLFYKHS